MSASLSSSFSEDCCFSDDALIFAAASDLLLLFTDTTELASGPSSCGCLIGVLDAFRNFFVELGVAGDVLIAFEDSDARLVCPCLAFLND